MKKTILTLIYFLLAALFLYAETRPSQSRDLQEIRASGVVRVGLRESATVYQVNEDTGVPEGYVWDLILAWAKEQGVRAEPVFINTMAEFWTNNGQIPDDLVTNENQAYTPDIYDRIDFAADIFAVVPWRTKLVDMHPYLRVGNILISRREDHILKPENLLGKRIFIFKTQSDYVNLMDFLNRYNLKYVELPVMTAISSRNYYETSLVNPGDRYLEDRVNLQNWSNPDARRITSPVAFYDYLLNDQSDVLITNSLTFFIYNMKNSSMRRYLTPTMTITEKPVEIGIASPKDRPELSSSLRSFFTSIQSNGINNDLLIKHAGIGLADYNRLLEIP